METSFYEFETFTSTTHPSTTTLLQYGRQRPFSQAIRRNHCLYVPINSGFDA